MGTQKKWPFTDHSDWAQEDNTEDVFDVGNAFVIINGIDNGAAGNGKGARYVVAGGGFVAANYTEGSELILKCRMQGQNAQFFSTCVSWMYIKLGSKFYALGLQETYDAGAGNFVLMKNTTMTDRTDSTGQDGSIAEGSISSLDVTNWNWFMIKIDPAGVLTTWLYLNQIVEPADNDPSWIDLAAIDGDFTVTVTGGYSTVAEIGISASSAMTGAFNDQIYIDDYVIKNNSFQNPGPVGLDPSIKFNYIYLRTALNGGGNARVISPDPFLTDVSVATHIAQLKKELTYTNAFSKVQWQGETSTLALSIDEAEYEAEEILRKTMFTEVGASPVIFATFIRQVNVLNLIDKDGNFVNRGITTSHLVAFAKADTKVFEARPVIDAFTITETDFSTPFVPNTINNGKDEEAYYYDSWVVDDTDKAHTMFDTTSTAFVVKYPTNIFEKFNNLGKLNKLVIKTTISHAYIFANGKFWTTAVLPDNLYQFVMYNYHTAAFEAVRLIKKSEMLVEGTVSVLDNTWAYSDGIAFETDIADQLKNNYDDWNNADTYNIGDRAIHNNILFTATVQNSNDEPPSANWQRTVYDFINYQTTAGSASIFSKLNTIVATRTPSGTGMDGKGMHIWAQSLQATFDEDNEPEFSTATISAVSASQITLDQTSGLNLPYEDGYGVDDQMFIVKSIEDYLQDAWDASNLVSDLGALIIDIDNATIIGLTDDHTFKTFFTLMQLIGEITNSSFWADYDAPRKIRITGANNHASSAVVLTQNDIENYYSGGFTINYDASKQRNKLRIIGDNVNFAKTLTPDNDPFDLGDETEILDDSSIQTLLQASDLADALTPRYESSEIIINLTLNYTNPKQNYFEIEIGRTVALLLPNVGDTSIASFSGANELLIIAIELNNNEATGHEEHATLTLQQRYS